MKNIIILVGFFFFLNTAFGQSGGLGGASDPTTDPTGVGFGAPTGTTTTPSASTTTPNEGSNQGTMTNENTLGVPRGNDYPQQQMQDSSSTPGTVTPNSTTPSAGGIAPTGTATPTPGATGTGIGTGVGTGMGTGVGTGVGTGTP